MSDVQNGTVAHNTADDLSDTIDYDETVTVTRRASIHTPQGHTPEQPTNLADDWLSAPVPASIRTSEYLVHESTLPHCKQQR